MQAKADTQKSFDTRPTHFPYTPLVMPAKAGTQKVYRLTIGRTGFLPSRE
jgi:hypothetical protein